MLKKYFILKLIGKSFETDNMNFLVGKILPLLLILWSHPGVTEEDYRNFIYEGMRLGENCKSKKIARHKFTPWQEQQLKRTVYSTLQYIGIGTTIKYLSLYARHFDFNQEEYDHLGKGLIGNYCSANITTMSRTTLIKKWIASFYHPNDQLPSRSKRPIFKYFSPLVVDEEKIRKREFSFTVELFKTFCSWGNDADDLRLLVPLVKNPAVMAHTFRHLTHTQLEWNKKVGELLYRTDSEASSISCKNLLCRLGIQQHYVLEELNQLYCSHFRDVDYKKGENVPPKIQKIIESTSETKSQLMTSHFISLLTLTPDFFLYAEKFSDLARFARMPMEGLWKKWMTGDKQTINPVFPYEELMILDTIPAPAKKSPLELVFQVNFGEWDRAVYRLGRIKRVLHLNIFNNILAHARKLEEQTPGLSTSYLKKMLHHKIAHFHSQTPLPVTVETWSAQFIQELSTRIRRSKKIPPFGDARKFVSVPVEIYYAPFALQYLHRK